MSKSQEQTMDNNHQHLMEEREKYNAKLKNWKTSEEDTLSEKDFEEWKERWREIAKARKEKKDKKTCLQLQNMFHMAMLMQFLPNLNTRTSMMNYLNTRGNPDWDYTYIWSLADSNKIDWVHDYGDPTPYEEYKKDMNNRLAKILRPE